jgi:hypothetical protein
MLEVIVDILSNDLMFLILGFILISLVIWLYNIHNDTKSDIDLADLVMGDGKISDSKLIRIGSWLISSWGFIFLLTRDLLTEWYFIGYMGAWVLNALISKNISMQSEYKELEHLKRGRSVRNRNDEYDPRDGE